MKKAQRGSKRRASQVLKPQGSGRSSRRRADGAMGTHDPKTASLSEHGTEGVNKTYQA